MEAEWDRLIEEARLRGDVGAQLAAAQQREAKARRDMEEIHVMFEDLSARVKLDEEAAAKIRRSRMSCSRRMPWPVSGPLRF